MKRYDNIVVGSGISGLTLALLLGMNGRSVLLLEKKPRIGGALTRFYKHGIPFDTGFHFTGGFLENGILRDMLTVLGIHDYIEPIYILDGKDNRFVFEDEQKAYDMPSGFQEVTAKLKGYFPGEEKCIDRYFEMIRNVCSQTVAMDLRNISLSPDLLDEDYISLDKILNGLTNNRVLKGLLAGYSMCYGVKPTEISFANHSRVGFALYESVARVKDGGDAFINGFRNRFPEFDIDIMRGTYITECVDIRDHYVGRFVLNTGEEISCNQCLFTIHPKEILKTLPREYLSKAFIDRVNSFEPSIGFFSVYGVVDPNAAIDDFGPSILSLFPTSDLNKLMDPGHTGDQALVIMKNVELVNGTPHRVLNASELSFPEHVKAWKNSRSGQRPSGYHEYKKEHTDKIKERIIKAYPEYRDYFRVIDSASVLTFRDYLHSYDGAAYGVKQKIGQYSLFGKLPLRNLYAAGQSAMLPGVVGAMTSSFIVVRSIVGKEDYSRFIEKRLCS